MNGLGSIIHHDPWSHLDRINLSPTDLLDLSYLMSYDKFNHHMIEQNSFPELYIIGGRWPKQNSNDSITKYVMTKTK